MVVLAIVLAIVGLGIIRSLDKGVFVGLGREVAIFPCQSRLVLELAAELSQSIFQAPVAEDFVLPLLSHCSHQIQRRRRFSLTYLGPSASRS